MLPFLYFLKVGEFRAAMFTMLLHDYCDHLDGIVAKAHNKMGYRDDALLGSFLDAFCDKVRTQ